MNKYIGIIALVLVVVGGFVYMNKAKPAPVVVEEDINGCYVATLGKDVYTLSVLSEKDGVFDGTLSFKNFEKDSSSGSYKGTYKDGILLGDYSFQSEGMNSVMQVIFKKTGNDFVRGYGDLNSDGTRFTDLSKITYDTSAVFKAGDCTVAEVPKGKLPADSAPVAPAASITSQKWIWDRTVMSDGKIIKSNKPGVFSITLKADGNVAGTTDCNGFFASYAVGSDGVIKIDQMGSTMMFCEGSQESIFMTDVGRANRYMLDSSGNLVLLLPYDSGSIMFKK